MSKKYKNKTCTYCMTPNSSEDGDHVVSKNFFLPDKRANLPKVPACKECNNRKSMLEHYLTAMMPFAGRHADASETLRSMVPKRLAKNKKLHITLYRAVANASQNSSARPMQLPFDNKQLLTLYELITKGLAYHHWGIHYLSDYFVNAIFLTRPGCKIFKRLFSLPTQARVQHNLGDGTFVYEGVWPEGFDKLTVWRMSLYGTEFGESHGSESSKEAYILAAPRHMSGTITKLFKDLGLQPWYLQIMAGQGNTSAQNDIGLMYAQGQDVPQDYKLAVELFRLAAEQNDTAAQYNLGLMYLKGRGIPPDHVQAHMWADIAATNASCSEKKNKLTELRDFAAKQMTANQIVEARKLAKKHTSNK